MIVSILVISSTAQEGVPNLFSPMVKNQVVAFTIGSFLYLFLACFDYRLLREWTWFVYLGIVVMLIGLYFTAPIHNVRRWYRFPFIPFDIQPSEYAKFVVVLTLSWFLEKKMMVIRSPKVCLQALLIVLIPFALILKQPDLGTALIVFSIALAIFYFWGVNRTIVKALLIGGSILFGFVLLVFLGILSHEEMRPFFTTFMKEYQYERLNPNTYHQRAGLIAIALGKVFGSGFGKSEFTGHQWLPYAYTDSVFPAFSEQFGLIGAFFLLFLFFSLIYCSFQVTGVARDPFGKLLSLGMAVYIAMHVIINIGMMSGFLPITGVPLILVSYGGSSVVSTMAALGVLQSIYARRFTFS
ncbi:MAG: FtsW/RodA/SpoVE family cell cycle protein [Verrucomicrobia bacterium]|nr:FtsW/RodA/SpoVE family cell cycle protein [Verrucomicrobiota bacterium]